MERLTYDFCIGNNHCWQVKGADNLECREVCRNQDGKGCKDCPIAKAFDRLAAYEDTGLEPEDFKRSFDEDALLKLTGQFLDVTPNRLRELAQADREGRCVVLPAKPDQIIYQWRKSDDCPSVSRLDGVQISGYGEITYPIWCGYLTPEDFGKTVFLTCEEAALRREQE